MHIVESHAFRVTRDADMEIQELEAADLLETIEESVRLRRFGNIVRIELNDDMPERVRNLLLRELDVDPNDGYVVAPEDLYVLDPPLGLSGLMRLYTAVDRPDLRDASFVPGVPAALAGAKEPGAVFEAVRKRDILLHHPYDSFKPVVQFLRDAARDPDVLAIKQTLYRVGRDSPVVDALLQARENHKQVAVLVELKARFDEESNIGWARRLEREGVHVAYGLVGLKTHSKIALVVRREGGHIRRYVHLATGNYNAVTARLYTDMGMFTCDDDIGADASDLFNFLTGYSAKEDYRKLLVAPIGLRQRIVELIEREIRHAESGVEGHLMFKMNSLVDKRMIQLLYRASQAGVRADLNVRGICGLRPGVPGLSENVRVTSIVGRFLEHSRIYWFRNGGRDEVYLGSADLMPRNLDRRVEVVFPVRDTAIVSFLRDRVMAVTFGDNVKSRQLRGDGSYTRVRATNGETRLDSQAWFLAHRPSGYL
jgi:polyphosphate kinase